MTRGNKDRHENAALAILTGWCVCHRAARHGLSAPDFIFGLTVFLANVLVSGWDAIETLDIQGNTDKIILNIMFVSLRGWETMMAIFESFKAEPREETTGDVAPRVIVTPARRPIWDPVAAAHALSKEG